MRSVGNSSSISPKGIVAIVGVGPRLGRSIARKFAHEGYTVAILARDLERLSRLAEEIAREEKGQVFAIRIDCSDSRSIQEGFESVLSLGFVEVLVYNAYHWLPSFQSTSTDHLNSSSMRPTRFFNVSVHSFEKSVTVSSVGPFYCAQQVLPRMVERGRGTILFTGCSASLNGIAGFSELCCGKFALRALSQCLAKEFQPLGIHVAHVILDGALTPVTPTRIPTSATATSSSGSSSCAASAPSTSRTNINVTGEMTRVDHHQQQQLQTTAVGDSSTTVDGLLLLDPDIVAQTYWQLHLQDRSAWTQEIDLRPSPAVTTATFTTNPNPAARYFF